MDSRIDAALERHHKGYNCAQAVACTYCDLAGISERDCFRMMEGMGLGMGGMRGTCGALTGACAVVGMIYSDGNLEHPATKRQCYKVSSAVVDRFHELVGDTTCGIIKGNRGKTDVLCSCDECVARASRAVEEVVLTDL